MTARAGVRVGIVDSGALVTQREKCWKMQSIVRKDLVQAASSQAEVRPGHRPTSKYMLY